MHQNIKLYALILIYIATRFYHRNELFQDTKKSTSICAFKHRLNYTTIDVPLFYCDGKRIGQVYHARLRAYCSSLNHHLDSEHTTDRPLCTCGRNEIAKYDLFECNRFDEFRQEMVQEISPLCEPTLDTLLHGKRELSDLSNKYIFISIQNYLITAKLN